MLSKIKSALEILVKGQLIFNEPLGDHTSFKIGGRADAFIVPKDVQDVAKIMAFAGANGIPVTTIGNGSKLLVQDEGINGIALNIKNCLDNVSICRDRVTVGAGYSLSKLCQFVAAKGFSGLEFGIGIPGTVGGAAVMNAGAHGLAMSSVIDKVRVVDFDGQVQELVNSDVAFGYRSSKLQDGKLVVTEVDLKLRNGITYEIERLMKSQLDWRKRRQPLNMHSAGCIFKNVGVEFAGRLIELAGCKGMTVGDAQVSYVHANFIINTGNAKAVDVQQLIFLVQKEVAKKFGVVLPLEIRIIGNWSLHMSDVA